MVERYGAAAVYGNRVLSAQEIIGMSVAGNVVQTVRAWQAAENRTDWIKRNPAGWKSVEWAMRLHDGI